MSDAASHADAPASSPQSDPLRGALQKIERLKEAASAGEAPRYRCSVCRDRGVVVLDGGRFAKPCDGGGGGCPIRTYGSSISITGVPKSLRPKKLADYQPTHQTQAEARDMVAAMIRDPGDRGPLLFGPPGRGKSMLLKCWLVGICRTHGRSGLWISAADVVEEVRGAESQSAARRDLSRRIRSAGVLVVDELGMARASNMDFTHQIMHEVWNSAIEAETLVGASSNCGFIGYGGAAPDFARSLGELAEALGKSTMSRVLGKTRTQTVLGDDWRLRDH